MAQTLDLSTKITGGQYDGTTLHEVIGKDPSYVRVQVRKGTFILRDGAKRVLDGMSRLVPKQNEIKKEDIVKNKELDENGVLPALKVDAQKALDGFKLGTEGFTKGVVLEAINKLPELEQKIFSTLLEDIVKEKLQLVSDLKAKIVSAITSLSSDNPIMSVDDINILIKELPSGEQKLFTDQISVYEKILSDDLNLVSKGEVKEEQKSSEQKELKEEQKSSEQKEGSKKESKKESKKK